MNAKKKYACFMFYSFLKAWSGWGSWSVCNYTCGGGIRQRTRSCRGGTSCVGKREEEELCNAEQCPSECKWMMLNQQNTAEYILKLP